MSFFKCVSVSAKKTLFHFLCSKKGNSFYYCFRRRILRIYKNLCSFLSSLSLLMSTKNASKRNTFFTTFYTLNLLRLPGKKIYVAEVE